MTSATIQAFFDDDTNTVSYLVSDPASSESAIIDSVLDYDQASGQTSTTSADAVIAAVREQGREVSLILETHVHADHLSAAPYIQEQIGGKIGIGAHITEVQETFGKVFNEGTAFERDGSQFDLLLGDGDRLNIGSLPLRVIHTPGHTPACLSYVIGDAVFVGDTIFMPDFGTARTDFPGSSAEDLYRSIQRLFELPDETRVFTAHDYKAPGREEFAWESTIGEQKARNVHVANGQDMATFVQMREALDAKLGMPRLILPSVQVDMRGGEMPPAEENGQRYLKIPVNGFGS
ncbi:MAG: MBL fold metallo-hydrolase [Pseudomonadota bacterium]|nr:MBL fold metallo-hydrolase [Pseudomonadota bacterium]